MQRMLNDIDNYIRAGENAISLPTEIASKSAEMSSDDITNILVKLSALESEYQEILKLRRETSLLRNTPVKPAPKHSATAVSFLVGGIVYQLAENNCPTLLFSLFAGAGAYQATSNTFGLYQWWQQRQTEAVLNENISYVEARQNLNTVKTRIDKLREVLNKAYKEAIEREISTATNNISNTALTKQ